MVSVALVAISVAVLLTLLSLREAGLKSFRRGLGNAHLVLSAEGSPLSTVLNAIFYVHPPRNAIPMSVVEEISASFPWAWAIPTQLGDSYVGFPVLAVGEGYFENVEPVAGHPWALARGAWPTSPFHVVLGSEVARRTQLLIGDHIHLSHGSQEDGHVHEEMSFDVVGILAPSQSQHDRVVFSSLEGSWLIHAIDRRHAAGLEEPKTPEDLLEEDRLVTGVLLRLPTRANRSSSAALQQMHDVLRRDDRVTVASPAAQIDRLWTIISGIDVIFLAMAGAVLVSSCIAIMLSLWTSMELRRRQLAILRVLGASKGRVLGLVLSESLVMGFIGAAAGIGLAWAGGFAAAAALQVRTGVRIEPHLDLRYTLAVAAAAVILAALAGVGPAIRAYRTNVAHHLRPLG
jgi:putative ABC transport system permease protein